MTDDPRAGAASPRWPVDRHDDPTQRQVPRGQTVEHRRRPVGEHPIVAKCRGGRTHRHQMLGRRLQGRGVGVGVHRGADAHQSSAGGQSADLLCRESAGGEVPSEEQGLGIISSWCHRRIMRSPRRCRAATAHRGRHRCGRARATVESGISDASGAAAASAGLRPGRSRRFGRWGAGHRLRCYRVTVRSPPRPRHWRITHRFRNHMVNPPCDCESDV